MNSENIRCFIAIELPDPVRITLAAIQDGLRVADRQAAQAVRWVDPTGIHLTLKFLGATPRERLPAIVTAMEQAAAGCTPFSLQIGDLGCFPSVSRPRVLWVGVVGALDQLRALHEAIENRVSPLGFPSEERGFSPHLTLGRVRDTAGLEERRRLGELMTSQKVTDHPLFTVSAISLMRSDLQPTGPIYTRLREVHLGG